MDQRMRRTDEVTFRLNVPRKVAGFDILHVVGYRPGPGGDYASAVVVTRRDADHFCTHRLWWRENRETDEWTVESGHYDMTWERAMENAYERAEGTTSW